ncbi:MAG: hypothetical protein WBD51_05675, partial [Burkholderiaceae bacterium]
PRPCVTPDIELPLQQLELGPSARPRVLGVAYRRDSVKLSIVRVFQAELVNRVMVASQNRAGGWGLRHADAARPASI